MVTLSTAGAAARARKTRLVVTDCDGVLTDAGVYYSADGEVMKRFSIRDGMGVERLRDAGIETAIMTGERSGSVVARAKKLSITKVWLGVKQKGPALELALRDAGVGADEVAYIGDDVNDLDALALASARGLSGAPRDALASVRAAVHHVAAADGGHGAFRDFAEWILHLRGTGPSPRPRRAGPPVLRPRRRP